MILHSLQFLNKNILSSGKIAKIRGSWGGGRYDPVEWKFPGGGGSKTKVFSLGVWRFSEITQFQQYPRESKPGGRPVC